MERIGPVRLVALLVLSVLVGLNLLLPAGAHVTRKLPHLLSHLNPRYINVNEKAADAELLDGKDSTAFLGANGKAADAEQLDGINSTGFIRGNGEVTRGAVATPPGEGRHLFGRFNDPGPPNPNVGLGYICPSNLANNGEVTFFNQGTDTLNVFSDNGGGNPSDFRQVPPNGGFSQSASASGDHITIQAQGAGTIHLEVFSVHRATDCHAQSIGVIAY